MTTDTTRVLSATERRSLERLLKADFEAARAELHDLCVAARDAADKQRDKEVKAASKDKAQVTRQAQAELDIIAKETIRQINAVTEAAAARGFKVETRNAYTFEGKFPLKVTDVRFETAYAKHAAQYAKLEAAYTAAEAELKKREQETYRALLMNALTGEAVQGFLDSVPKASDLFKVES